MVVVGVDTVAAAADDNDGDERIFIHACSVE